MQNWSEGRRIEQKTRVYLNQTENQSVIIISQNTIHAEMKSLKDYMFEAVVGHSDIYFPNVSSAMLFALELKGQISDGYWENSRPYDHWEWVVNADIHIDPSKVGYTGPWHKIRYSTRWLESYLKNAMKGNDGYTWVFRVLNIAKLGSVMSPQDFYRMKDNEAFRTIVEHLPKDEVDQAGLEKVMLDGKPWIKKYWSEVKFFFTDQVLKKFYSSKYDFSDFKADLDKASEAMNTPI